MHEDEASHYIFSGGVYPRLLKEGIPSGLEDPKSQAPNTKQ
jgi:hypothetical protein